MNLRQTLECYSETATTSMPKHGHPETPFTREKQRKGGPDVGGTTKAQSSGGQSTGSSKIARKFRVVDLANRIIHDNVPTQEEAIEKSAGAPYTKVVSYFPEDDTPKVRDKARKRPFDNQVRVHRRTIPTPDTSFVTIK